MPATRRRGDVAGGCGRCVARARATHPPPRRAGTSARRGSVAVRGGARPSATAARRRARPPGRPRSGRWSPGPGRPTAATAGPGPGRCRRGAPRSRGRAARPGPPPPGQPHQHERPRRRLGHRHLGERAQPGQQMGPVRGDLLGRRGRLRQRRRRTARLGGGQRRRGDRPQRLGPRQLRHRPLVRQHVADPQPRQPPGLGQAAQHHQPRQHTDPPGQRLPLPGHRVHERLVHHQGPTRPGQRRHRVRRVQYRGRVGGIAHHHQVRVVRHRRRIQPEAVPLRQQHPPDRVPGVPQRRLRLGELRMHHHRPPRPDRPRQQHERLRGTGRQQHPTLRETVPDGDRPTGRPAVRIRRQPVQRRGDLGLQPGRGSARPDVDRQIRQTRQISAAHLRIAVVPQVDLFRAGAGAGRGQRRSGHAGPPADVALKAVPGSASPVGRASSAARPANAAPSATAAR
ncbi:hypothetical protein DC74_2360 [Streptomyces noursei]|nr:hypothetical protein DC74_2360 [Streptomyces noursei]